MRVLSVSVVLVPLALTARAAPSDESSRHRPAREAVGGPQRGSLRNVVVRWRRLLRGQQEVLRGSEVLLDELRRQDSGNTQCQAARSRRLAERQERVQWETVALLDVLRRDGAAVAFVEVVEQLLKEMERVRLPLAAGAPDRNTVTDARDLVETLRDAVHALGHTRHDASHSPGAR